MEVINKIPDVAQLCTCKRSFFFLGKNCKLWISRSYIYITLDQSILKAKKKPRPRRVFNASTSVRHNYSFVNGLRRRTMVRKIKWLLTTRNLHFQFVLLKFENKFGFSAKRSDPKRRYHTYATYLRNTGLYIFSYGRNEEN